MSWLVKISCLYDAVPLRDIRDRNWQKHLSLNLRFVCVFTGRVGCDGSVVEPIVLRLPPSSGTTCGLRGSNWRSTRGAGIVTESIGANDRNRRSVRHETWKSPSSCRGTHGSSISQEVPSSQDPLTADHSKTATAAGKISSAASKLALHNCKWINWRGIMLISSSACSPRAGTKHRSPSRYTPIAGCGTA